MCGHVVVAGRDIWIDCEIRREWWYDPGPLIDFRRLKFGAGEVAGPQPEPWRVDLTRIVQMLEMASQFEDPELAAHVGKMVAKAGTQIAERSEVDLQFDWDSHETIQ